MREYNLFTKKLFEQGYTFENYPGYAKMPNTVCNRELFDIMGGFQYESWYRDQKVYSTGCGLLCRGSEFSNGYTSYMGIDWKPENNNPVICCPYKKEHCTFRSPLWNHISGGGATVKSANVTVMKWMWLMTMNTVRNGSGMNAIRESGKNMRILKGRKKIMSVTGRQDIMNGRKPGSRDTIQ